MKQSKEIEGYRKMVQEFEERGAARERAKYQNAINKAVARIQDGVTGLLALLEQPKEKVQPQPKKRKAVEANEADINLVHEWIANATAMGNPVLPKQLKNCGIGIRTIAAACRSLVESRVLEKVGTKGYRLVQRKENGLDEEEMR